MIYFVQAVGGQGPIKIGYAYHLGARVEALQRGSPARLIVLAALDKEMADEKLLHERFIAWRLYGEWFEPCEELLLLVAEARKETDPKWIDYQQPLRAAKQRNWNPGARYRQKRKGTRLPNYFAEKSERRAYAQEDL